MRKIDLRKIAFVLLLSVGCVLLASCKGSPVYEQRQIWDANGVWEVRYILNSKTECALGDFYSKYKKSESYKSGDFTLPSPALSDGSLDFSFSGLKTAAINLLHRYEQAGRELDRELFAARYTYEAVEAVAKKTDAALASHPGAPLVVAGGVAANSHLRRRLAEVAAKRKSPLTIPPLSLCGDNAAMIAAQGYYEYEAGRLADSSLNASALDSISFISS